MKNDKIKKINTAVVTAFLVFLGVNLGGHFDHDLAVGFGVTSNQISSICNNGLEILDSNNLCDQGRGEDVCWYGYLGI